MTPPSYYTDVPCITEWKGSVVYVNHITIASHSCSGTITHIMLLYMSPCLIPCVLLYHVKALSVLTNQS